MKPFWLRFVTRASNGIHPLSGSAAIARPVSQANMVCQAKEDCTRQVRVIQLEPNFL